MADNQNHPKKIVLAYSGGLDTSVILPWLKERYPGVKLVAYAAELGQGDELKGIEDKAYKSGADEVIVEDLRQQEEDLQPGPQPLAHLPRRRRDRTPRRRAELGGLRDDGRAAGKGAERG